MGCYNAVHGRAGEKACPEEITRSTTGRVFDPSEPVHASVAERDGRVVGLLHYLFHRSTTMLNPTCYPQEFSRCRRNVGVVLLGR